MHLITEEEEDILLQSSLRQSDSSPGRTHTPYRAVALLQQPRLDFNLEQPERLLHVIPTLLLLSCLSPYALSNKTKSLNRAFEMKTEIMIKFLGTNGYQEDRKTHSAIKTTDVCWKLVLS